jgi:predicted GH43/DUF377 family glycosyl hydrolase
MERYSGNPILEPIAEQTWESRGVFNAGVLYNNGQIHIFYRAIGNDNISRIGYAKTVDGFTLPNAWQTQFLNQQVTLKEWVLRIQELLNSMINC